MHSSTRDMKNLGFQIMQTNNYETNTNSMHICFPIKTKLKSDSDSNKDADLITLKSFFAHFVKEISMTRYGNKKQSMTTFSPYEIYQYSDSMLKYVRKNALKN